jgi:hypothetical protein
MQIACHTAPDVTATLSDVADAIEVARVKIQRRTASEVNILRSNLGLLLDDFIGSHAIKQISWLAVNDRITPAAALDIFCACIAKELGEIEFRRFLENFANGLLELNR